MKNFFVSAALLSCIGAASAQATSEVAYDITVQNEAGHQSQLVVLPVGGDARTLVMQGAAVRIEPPAAEGGASTIKLFATHASQPSLLHAARIHLRDGEPVKVAYSVCGGKVKYESPNPEKLQKCAK